MTGAVFYKLLAIFLTVGLGYVAGRLRWLDSGTEARDPARVLGNAAFSIFVPALLFRTTARLDFAALPVRTVAAYFVPAVVFALAVYGWQRWRLSAQAPVAQPAARAITASFGNSVQLGIPLAAALFGEPGLAIHIALVSLHALILLTLPTVLVELDLASAQAQAGPRDIAATLRSTVRNTVLHPVVLPVLAGLVWNFTGLGLHPVVDETLAVLGSAVVPVCLVLLGLSLAYYGVQASWRSVVALGVLKLLVLPALVLVTAHWGFGLDGVPLAVLVLMAALPTGSNALIFAQRYGTGQAEATAVSVVSTVAFALTASGWIGVLAWLG
ncbi:MAG: AEC family transporter [Rubrivivax sp.]|nr:AEC family transporter [Rubrivivax sp.]